MDDEAGSISSPVRVIVIHPDWNFNSEKFDADIAIVVLEASVTFSRFVQPICLPPFSNDYVSGNGTVVGWGKSENSGHDHHDLTPSKLVVPAIDAAYCYPHYPLLAEAASHRMFCGGYEDAGKAPCFGDSGGGLYVLNSGINRFWTIRGIVSGSLIYENDCDINKFTLYTNVAMFSDWIAKVVQEAMTSEWQFVDFQCEDLGGLTRCFTWDDPVTRNAKIRRLDFSSSTRTARGEDLYIDFEPQRFIPAGVGTAFPKMKQLAISAKTIEAVQRRDFVDMKKLKVLRIFGGLMKFWPEDLFADLPNLEKLVITGFKVEKFPDNIFANQRELTFLGLHFNKLTALQKDLLQNSLKLEFIQLGDNNLREIAVDFTKFTGIRYIELARNECIDKIWLRNQESVPSSIQDLIYRNCTKT